MKRSLSLVWALMLALLSGFAQESTRQASVVYFTRDIPPEGEMGPGTTHYAVVNFDEQAETPDFAVLSQHIWDLMAVKDADALKEIFHPNAMFVHMGGYWGCEQELRTIGQGWIHYKHAEVYGVDVKQINDDNWAVYSTIKLDAALGGSDNIVTTPFFVTQTFTREDGKWWMTAMVFTTRTTGPGIDPHARATH